ncbi:3-carboxy-cis,cis-muconate cycloisomerase [Rhodobacteraceae bacterium WD3A24]|nr:3-carboxy-cis,cis-muconate cycloisomerase [Rhodobacteraceae bacterium WD3A24]
MPASAFDSAIYRDLFGDAEMARLFTDGAETRAMLLVEGALARAQGDLGMIPAESADFIHKASMEVQIDPAGLAKATGVNAVPVPALVAAFRSALEAPDHAQYVHWGATSQDIMDTALVLRLRQVLTLAEDRLASVLDGLATLAEQHADTPMAARTYGQAATPTSFGEVAAGWGRPLLRHRERLAGLRPRLLQVSLAGAAGTLAAMGDKGPALRARLAEALDLADPGASWHPARDSVAELSSWAAALTSSLGKMGEDLILLTQTGIGEVRLGSGGGSSTLPQKQNPVQPSLLVALARHAVALDSAIQGAALHRQQRDGAAWFVEWLNLPQLCIGLGRALDVAGELTHSLQPRPERMRAGLDDGLGLIHAEALSFALTDRMPRPDAQAAVKDLCLEAQESGTPLPELARGRWPDTDWAATLLAEAQMGTAPADARSFARRVRG